MAKLEVFATPAGALDSYTLNIHGGPACDGDVVEILGQSCGDGSTQFVRYLLKGEVGATLRLVLRCPHDGNPGHISLDETLHILPEESTVWFKL